MPLGTDHLTNVVADNFIPELWSDDIIATYRQNLVAAPLVTPMSHEGKKGSVVHIPSPLRGAANLKVANAQVTLNAPSNTSVDVTIDRHYEYSILEEDITSKQALDTFRGFYTKDAAYQLAKQIDTDILAQAETFQGGTGGLNTWLTSVIGGDGTTAYNGSNASALTSAGILAMIQLLDDQDVPHEDRALILPPTARRTILGLPEFTEHQFVGEAGKMNSIRNGIVGDVYGIPVFITTNAPTTTTSDRVGVLLHKSSIVLAEQMKIRSQQQYKQEYLGTLFTSDTLYGVDTLRDNAGVAIAIPA